MSLTDSDIDEFIQLVKEEAGKDITRAEAYDEANRLLGFFRAIYRPIPNEPKDGRNQ